MDILSSQCKAVAILRLLSFANVLRNKFGRPCILIYMLIHTILFLYYGEALSHNTISAFINDLMYAEHDSLQSTYMSKHLALTYSIFFPASALELLHVSHVYQIFYGMSSSDSE